MSVKLPNWHIKIICVVALCLALANTTSSIDLRHKISTCLVLIKADDGWVWALFIGNKNFVDGPTSKYPILQKNKK